jgi:hypothetical protein
LISNIHQQSKEGSLFLGGIDALTSECISTLKINAVLTIMTEKQKRKCKLSQKIEELDEIGKHMSLMIHE